MGSRVQSRRAYSVRCGARFTKVDSMAGLTVILRLILLSSPSFAWNNFRSIQGFGGVPLLRLQRFRHGVFPPLPRSRADETEALVLASEPKMPERFTKKREIVVSAAPEGWMPDPVRFNIIPAVPDKENGGREVFMIPESSDLYARFMPIEAVPTSDRMIAPARPEVPAPRPDIPSPEVAAPRGPPVAAPRGPPVAAPRGPPIAAPSRSEVRREKVPFLLLTGEESRSEELSRIPKEAAFRTVAIGHGGESRNRNIVRINPRRQQPASNRRQPITTTARRTDSNPVAAREPPLPGRQTLPSTPTPSAVNSVSNNIAPAAPSKKAARKAFKRCHGKCVQKRCLPIGDLVVYEKCVVACTKVCEQ